ncbi:fimbrial protein [Serratia quinivorans]|uniref:fimbrial protein n=1 Tax=Serratia quinivorans TaxID=137545 RepID=UPI00107EA828|nr:fimbrial protein [Serratia quinivorans]QBX68320.1 adhesin [Serratia quinivorans]
MASKNRWTLTFNVRVIFNLIAISLLTAFSTSSFGTVSCIKNCPYISTTSLNRTLGGNENEPGKIFGNGNTSRGPANLELKYTVGYHNVWSVLGDDPVPSVGTYSHSEQWKKIDDYISIALIKRGDADLPGQWSYVPTNKEIIINNPETKFQHAGSLEVKVRIDKKIVNGTYSKSILAATQGLCNGRGCRSKGVIMSRLYFNLNITVPQTCTLNSGQTLDLNFGDISSAAFTSAGARAEGVNDIVRSIPIECDGIAANTAMTVRLQADKVSGNAVVTNTNSDVGFVVADSNGTALTPNNLSSVIPFTLDGYGNSNVTIRVYPVSVTGNKPVEGPVTSQAYLRVDFA